MAEYTLEPGDVATLTHPGSGHITTIEVTESRDLIQRGNGYGVMKTEYGGGIARLKAPGVGTGTPQDAVGYVLANDHAEVSFE